jgi:hypothetical protein
MKGLTICIIFLMMLPVALFADQTLVAHKIEKAPVTDGNGDDPEWTGAMPITTHDKVANIDVLLKSVYTDKEIFFWVSFPDPDMSAEHKPLVWDKKTEMYKTGPERGDCFIFKWNMEAEVLDLSVYADKPYTADIWFWKAGRTNPVGYADDKQQIFSMSDVPRSVKIISKSGHSFHLSRPGDAGSPAYVAEVPIEYKGDKLPRFKNCAPSGSRADVRAKGQWQSGIWSIEFRRALGTGHPDDIQFDIKEEYQFGISRYGIGGKRPDPKKHPYGTGDVSESLTLKFGT